MRNARLWLGDVGDACAGFQPKKREEGCRLDEEVQGKCRGGEGVEVDLLRFVYGDQGVEGGLKLVGDVEAFRKRKGGEGEELVRRVREELGRVLEWCERKFGAGAWVDARSAWVKNSEEVQEISNDMVSGGKGYREF